ncbi:hypothetical protein LXA43DRAFT_973560 [Ganoderma leucocontextum]|nr:hypothetical protein LXA43DRAFT_973560 [Ganoderma leucocontextum]
MSIVDNTDANFSFFINPQYVNVTDIISNQAYVYVQAAMQSTYNQSVADITVPKWSFQYNFTGTRISLCGVVIPCIQGPIPAAQYAVDGTSQNISSVPNTTRTLLAVDFYTSDWFPFGAHMLTVNVTTATSNGPYLFDYLSVDISAKSSVPVGPIIGAVTGGVALLALIVLGGWWLWKQNRTEDMSTYAYVQTGQYDGPVPGHLDPYTVYRQFDAGAGAGHMPPKRSDRSRYSDASAGPGLTSSARAVPSSSSCSPSDEQHRRSSLSQSESRIFGAGAVTYNTGHTRGKAAETRMEAVRAQQRAVSGLSATTTSVPPPYAP